MAQWKMKGQYLKNCNCLASCPCDTIGFPAPHKFCEAVVAMNIQEGHFDDVDLSGLKWAGVVGSSRVDLQACKLEYSIVSPK